MFVLPKVAMREISVETYFVKMKRIQETLLVVEDNIMNNERAR